MNIPNNPDRPVTLPVRIETIVLLLAALAMLLAAGQLIWRQQASDQATTRQAGSALARMASTLVGDDARKYPLPARLQTLLRLQTGVRADYLAVISHQGELIASAGVTPDNMQPHVIGDAPVDWFGERRISLGDKQFTEFHAPVINNGKLVAFAVAGFDSARASVWGYVLLVLALLPIAYLLLTRRPPDQATRLASSQQKDLTAKANRLASDETPWQTDPVAARPSQTETAHSTKDAPDQSESGIVSSKLLVRQKDKLSSILESMSCAIMVLDKDGAVSYANKKLFELFGLKQGTVLGSKTESWCQNEELCQVLSSSQILQDKKCHNRRFDVSVDGAPVSVELSPLDNSEGSVMVMLFENEPVRSEQMAVSEYVSHVAHQIKTPLNTLYMYSELLQSKGFDSEAQTVRATRVIYNESRRMAKLIDNLLNINMLDSGSVKIARQKHNLKDCLDKAIDTVQASLDQHAVKIEMDMPDELPELQIDSVLLNTALASILENAIQYSDHDAQVCITVSQRDYDVRIDITDNGIGIDERDQKHIYDMFYRAENQRVRQVKGNGLGLPLAKRIIDGHGGSLFCHSKPGQGSVFSILLSKHVSKLEGVA